MRRILIAGCGYVGTQAGQLLTEQGHDVFGLRRTRTDFPGGFSPVTGDLLDPESLLNIPDGLDDLVITVSAGGFSEEQYRSVYVDGIGNLLDAVRRQRKKLRRVVFTSSTGVYGQTNGETVSETSDTEPAGFSGRVMLEAERQVLDVTGCGVCLRLGGIYGPGRDRLVRQVKAGEADIPAHPVYTNRIHRDDAAASIVHVLGLDLPEDVYNVVDTESAAYGDVIRWLAKTLNCPDPDPVPVDTEIRTRGGSKRVSSQRLIASGFTFQYPTFREGYGDLMRDMQGQEK